MAIKAPPNWQLKKILRQAATLKKITITLINDEYEQSTSSSVDYPIEHCHIEPITSEDLQFLPPGVLNIGDARGFFKELISSTICLSDFELATEYSYDPIKIEVSDGEARLKAGIDPCCPYYPGEFPIVKISGCIFSAPMYSFTVKETKPIKTEIKYILSRDNGATWKWWNGTAWSVSDGTYAQASTSSEISGHISTLGWVSGTFKVKAFLHSDDGTVTPELDEIKVTFGVKIEPEDRIVDQMGIEYEVRTVTDYYIPKSIWLKEVYMKKVTGE